MESLTAGEAIPKYFSRASAASFATDKVRVVSRTTFGFVIHTTKPRTGRLWTIPPPPLTKLISQGSRLRIRPRWRPGTIPRTSTPPALRILRIHDTARAGIDVNIVTAHGLPLGRVVYITTSRLVAKTVIYMVPWDTLHQLKQEPQIGITRRPEHQPQSLRGQELYRGPDPGWYPPQAPRVLCLPHEVGGDAYSPSCAHHGPPCGVGSAHQLGSDISQDGGQWSPKARRDLPLGPLLGKGDVPPSQALEPHIVHLRVCQKTKNTQAERTLCSYLTMSAHNTSYRFGRSR